jgi:signal transduction histidine kinase
LKTPVAIIKTNVQKSKGNVVQLLESAGVLERQCNRIDLIVQNLLVLARTRTRTLQLQHEDVELAPIVKRSVGDLAGRAAQPRVICEIDGDSRVRADPERLGLLLRDLADLACRSAAPGSRVAIEANGRDSCATIRVSYEALGAEEAMESLGRSYDETGLDRIVASAIAVAHGWALQEDTAGSRVTIALQIPTLRSAQSG